MRLQSPGSFTEISWFNNGFPGLGRFPGEGNSKLLQYSCLENPMDGGAWCRLLSMGSQRVGHYWVTSLSFHSYALQGFRQPTSYLFLSSLSSSRRLRIPLWVTAVFSKGENGIASLFQAWNQSLQMFYLPHLLDESPVQIQEYGKWIHHLFETCGAVTWQRRVYSGMGRLCDSFPNLVKTVVEHSIAGVSAV